MLVYERLQTLFGRKIKTTHAVALAELFHTSLESLTTEESVILRDYYQTDSLDFMLFRDRTVKAAQLGISTKDLLNRSLTECAELQAECEDRCTYIN